MVARLFTVLFGLVIMLTGLSGAASAQSTTVASPPTSLGEALPRASKMHQAFERFLSEAYLQDWFAAPEVIERHYASRLDRYWGRSNVGIRRVINDKRSYASRWPDRRFRLLRDSVRVVPVDGGFYDVGFDYEYDVTGPGRRGSGIGRTRLRVLLDDPRVQIHAEDGRVLRRYR